ncbi:hypothetical protein FWK35_00001009 [Aphis craccivora]|nr:hypothetical protein FWK35_00022532 [Aphis craccivora]KAF0769402.1 hypothetical protein FWK35_00006762 [Aphis craccivora]KAF0773240.1 hypothetical protein FWK35_00001009 [Aphis craccivora]
MVVIQKLITVNI